MTAVSPDMTAVDRLELAFARKARTAAAEAGRPAIGLFGGALPPALFAAAGLPTFDVQMEPETERGLACAEVEAVVEPFTDHSARRFLVRLACGALDHLAAIVFSRADAPAWLAWLYATELRRQRAASGRPALLLWNAQQTASAPVEAFNLAEARRLEQALAGLGGSPWSDAGLRAALDGERARLGALMRLETARRGCRIGGHEAMRWRNAGRYLDAALHASLIEGALDACAARPQRPGLRLGLAGSPVADGRLYDLLDDFGTVVADPHPLGLAWPPPVPPAGQDDLAAVLRAAATDALQPRALPVVAHRRAVAETCLEAGCEIVVFQLDEHDDIFGWDMPDIRARLEQAGVVTVDLGFRPDVTDGRPDDGWHGRSRDRLREAAARRGGGAAR